MYQLALQLVEVFFMKDYMVLLENKLFNHSVKRLFFLQLLFVIARPSMTMEYSSRTADTTCLTTNQRSGELLRYLSFLPDSKI